MASSESLSSTLSLTLSLPLSLPRRSSDVESWFSESSLAAAGIENSHLVPASLSVVAIVTTLNSYRWDITQFPTALTLIGSGGY
jgi:hypothetical protein